MIMTTIKLPGISGKRREIIQTIQGIINQSAENKGCLKADLYQGIDDKDILYFNEEWQTEKDLEEFKASKFMAVLKGLGPLLEEPLKIEHVVKITSYACYDRKI